MQKLETKLEIRGLGSKVTAEQLRREGNIALYKRSDGVFEVFIVKTAEAQVLFDKKYPAREKYPSNEDFGRSAWCFSSREDLANRKFEALLQDQTT